MRVPVCSVLSVVCATFAALLASAAVVSAQEQEVRIRKDLLPSTKTSLPAAADSALRCAMSGLHAMGTALLHAPIRSARGNTELQALLVGMQASMYSELGMVQRAEALFTSHRKSLLGLPYAPYGACLRANMALHHHRMGQREKAFTLITAAVRPMGDKAQCRAVAMGRYHLGVLMCWEGNDDEAVEHFANAAHTIDEGVGFDADAACYWGAYAETLMRLHRVEEADRAWRRAYTHALLDPVSRRRFARQIAIQHADLLIRLGESVRAAACLRPYTYEAEACADVLLTGMQKLVEARLALQKQDEQAMRTHLRAALWSLHQALTDESIPLTRRESLLLRRQASDAVDLTFSTLLRDTLRQPELERAAWDTHLAERAFRPHSLLGGNGAAAMAGLSWLESRTEWERRSFDPDLDPAQRQLWKPGSGLRAFAESLPDDGRGIIVRRFADVRGGGAPCYVGISVAPHQSVFPSILWFDRDGSLERKLIPQYARAVLKQGKQWKGAERSGENLWTAVGKQLVAELGSRATLILIPDGVFSQFDPSVLWDPEENRYLGEIADVSVMMHVPKTRAASAVRELNVLADPLVLRHDSLLCEAPRFLPHVCGAGDAGFSGGLRSTVKPLSDEKQQVQYGMLRENDGITLAEEIAAMKLSSGSAVLLPGCDLEIGRGFPVRSSRAIFTALADAGVPGIVHTLWPVDAELTTTFISYLEAELQRTPDLATAFHAARKQLRTAYPDPSKWGAYRLILCGGGR